MSGKRIFILLCFYLSINTVSAQKLTFDTYTNQLFLNIFQSKPDTTIASFLRLYTPSLHDNKPTTDVGKPLPGKTKYSLETHSFIFTSHPYFQPSFTNGQLDFFCQRYPEPIGVKVYDVKLWFSFDTQQEADIAFSKLVETYIPISSKKKISSLSGYQQAEFSEESAKNTFTRIKIRYTADNLNQHRYKILIETTNDL